MNKKVLIVDDSTSNVLLIQNFLEDEGYNVITSLNGKDAQKIATKENPDIILLDLMMPDISGFDVIKSIKNTAETKSIPIIFISASKDKGAAKEAISLGANAFIHKPIDFDVILSEIDKAIK